MRKYIRLVFTVVLVLFSLNLFAQEQTSKGKFERDPQAVKRLKPVKKADFDIQAIRDIPKGPGKVKFQVQYYINENHPNPCFITAYIPHRKHPNKDFVCLPAGRESQAGVFKGKNYFEDDMALVLGYTGDEPLKSRTIEIAIYDKDGILNSKLFKWAYTWKEDPSVLPPEPEKKEEKKEGVKKEETGHVYHYKLRKKRYQLEFFGGYASMKPDDLNMRIDHETAMNQFYNDQFYDYHVGQGDLLSWNKTTTGELTKVKNTTPYGARLKVRLTQSIYMLFVTKFFSASQISDVSHQYNLETSAGTGTVDVQYTDYTLKVKGSALMFGVHFEKWIGKNLELSAFLSGGPMWTIMEYGHKYRETDVTGTVVSQYDLKVEGSGYGPSIEAGGQIGFRLNKGWSLFVEAVYANMRAKPIAGAGSLNITAPIFSQETWSENWDIFLSNTERYWGTLISQRPSNAMEAGDIRVRRFIANLSGFQVRAGISFRF